MKTLSLQQIPRFRRAELEAYVSKNNFRKAVGVSAFSAGLILLSGFIMFDIQNPVIVRSSANPAPITVSADSGALAASTPIGINIANNGSIFVRGARVVSVSGGTIQTSVSWGSVNFAWAVETTGITKFLDHQGKKGTISDIKVGDIVNVTGGLISDDNKFVINADFVRE